MGYHQHGPPFKETPNKDRITKKGARERHKKRCPPSCNPRSPSRPQRTPSPRHVFPPGPTNPLALLVSRRPRDSYVRAADVRRQSLAEVNDTLIFLLFLCYIYIHIYVNTRAKRYVGPPIFFFILFVINSQDQCSPRTSSQAQLNFKVLRSN